MEFRIQAREGRWLVFRNGVPVLSTADYRQVEDMLDCAENQLRGTQADTRADKSDHPLPNCLLGKLVGSLQPAEELAKGDSIPKKPKRKRGM